MQPFWRRSILLRAAAQVIGIALVVGLGFVFLTAQLTERHTQESVSQRLRELVKTVEITAQIACFTKDYALEKEVVDGLMISSEVFGVAIVAGGETLAERDKDGGNAERIEQARRGRFSRQIA